MAVHGPARQAATTAPGCIGGAHANSPDFPRGAWLRLRMGRREAITSAGGLRAAVGGCAACPVSACVQAPSRAHAASAGSAGNTGRHIRGMHPRTGRMSGTWQSCQDYPLTTHVYLPGAQPGSDHRRIRRGQPPVAASGPARLARGPGRTLPAPPRRRPPSLCRPTAARTAAGDRTDPPRLARYR
jgi:hypothetical protein